MHSLHTLSLCRRKSRASTFTCQTLEANCELYANMSRSRSKLFAIFPISGQRPHIYLGRLALIFWINFWFTRKVNEGKVSQDRNGRAIWSKFVIGCMENVGWAALINEFLFILLRNSQDWYKQYGDSCLKALRRMYILHIFLISLAKSHLELFHLELLWNI